MLGVSECHMLQRRKAADQNTQIIVTHILQYKYLRLRLRYYILRGKIGEKFPN